MSQNRALILIFSVFFCMTGWSQEGNPLLRCSTPDQQTRALMYGPPAELGSDCGAGSTNPDPSYDPGAIYEINVVVHIIMNNDGSQGDISNALVDSQIDILNEDFLALAGTPGEFGTYSGIRFKLADTDPNGNPTDGITRSMNTTWFNDGGGYFNTLAWDPHRYMNLYTNQAGGNLGYVPFLPADGGGSLVGGAADRVVILWTTFGRDAPFFPFDQGRTGTHEVGHYLGLEHTFSGGCGSATAPGCYSNGDLLCDTLPESGPNFGDCTSGDPMTCGDPDPIHNYMDYSDDRCMNNFTVEQMRRNRCTLLNWRPNLYTVVGDCASSDLAVEAGDNVWVCEGSSVGLSAVASGGSGGNEFTWTPPAGLDDPDVANPTATPTATTTYTVTVNDATDCDASDTVTVYVVPNTYTTYLPYWVEEGIYTENYDPDGNGLTNIEDFITMLSICAPE